MRNYKKMLIAIGCGFLLLFQTGMIINRIGGSWAETATDTYAHLLCNDDAANTVATNEVGLNGTASTNTSNLSVAGKINDAFDFTAANTESIDYNQTFLNQFRVPFSKAFWLKPDDGQPAATQAMFGAGTAVGSGLFQIQLLASGQVQAQYYEGNVDVKARTNAAVFPDGATAWTHVFITVDATSIKIYIDSVDTALDPARSGDMSGSTMGDFDMSVNFVLGALNNAGALNTYFDGVIDDDRTETVAADQTEVDRVWNGGSGTEDN